MRNHSLKSNTIWEKSFWIHCTLVRVNTGTRWATVFIKNSILPKFLVPCVLTSTAGNSKVMENAQIMLEMAAKCSNYAKNSGLCFLFWIILFEADYAKNYASILYQCLFTISSGPFFVFHTVTTEQRIPWTFGHYQVNGKASIPALKQGKRKKKVFFCGDEKRAQSTHLHRRDRGIAYRYRGT